MSDLDGYQALRSVQWAFEFAVDGLEEKYKGREDDPISAAELVSVLRRMIKDCEKSYDSFHD